MVTSASWGRALGSAAIVNFVTLVGVALLGLPALRAGNLRGDKKMTTLSSGFAAGALLAAALFLMFTEALELTGHEENHHEEEHFDRNDHHHLRMLDEEHNHDDHDHGEEHEEHAETWPWSIAALGGFCAVLALDVLLSLINLNNVKAKAKENASSTDAEAPKPAEPRTEAEEADALQQKVSVRRLLYATLIGDAMHNFADGAFIATAFKTCSTSVGWAVVIGTVAHELAQEVADFLLLARVCGIQPVKALALNFVSGTTIFLGAIVVLASDLDDNAVGIILAFGGGIYVYNAGVECLPRVVNEESPAVKATAMGLFVLGAVAIGLVLISHEHCD
ncbi:hypothetical protein KFE25_002303 [Diacronema lutheri]|uniref:Uncharacterized protein n=1 Tax=Diacronema lutheri TaxID=2081491 RepID=A0A8J5X7T7_DIALT|nr:hypothetical protein KFE25_002303 [Diacronema lutheri]